MLANRLAHWHDALLDTGYQPGELVEQCLEIGVMTIHRRDTRLDLRELVRRAAQILAFQLIFQAIKRVGQRSDGVYGGAQASGPYP